VVATHALHALLMSELEHQLPREVYVRSEVGALSDMTPSRLLEHLQNRELIATRGDNLRRNA